MARVPPWIPPHPALAAHAARLAFNARLPGWHDPQPDPAGLLALAQALSLRLSLHPNLSLGLDTRPLHGEPPPLTLAELEAARQARARMPAAPVAEPPADEQPLVLEPGRLEAVRAEMARRDAARAERARLDALRAEKAQIEAARAEKARLEALREEKARMEAALARAAQQPVPDRFWFG